MELVEGDLDAHGQFQGGDLCCGKAGGNFECVFGQEQDVLGVAAMALMAGVAPGGHAHARDEIADARAATSTRRNGMSLTRYESSLAYSRARQPERRSA